MNSSQHAWGHGFNIAAWSAIVSFFIVLPFFGKPAFILLAIGSIFCALALAFYNAPSTENSRT